MSDRANPAVVGCPRHPDADACWRCTECGALLCEACVIVADFGRVKAHICPDCGERCDRLHVPPPPAPSSRVLRDFADAWIYPFAGPGKWMILVTTFGFWTADFFYGLAIIFLRVRLLGIFGVVACGLVAIILFATLVFFLFTWWLDAVAATITGSDEPPEWSGPTRWQGWLGSFGMTFASLAVCLLPASLYRIAWKLGYVDPAWPFWTLLLAAACMLPIAMLSCVNFGSISRLNPVFLVRSAIRAGWVYPLAVGVFVGAMFALAAGIFWLELAWWA